MVPPVLYSGHEANQASYTAVSTLRSVGLAISYRLLCKLAKLDAFCLLEAIVDLVRTQ